MRANVFDSRGGWTEEHTEETQENTNVVTRGFRKSVTIVSFEFIHHCDGLNIDRQLHQFPLMRYQVIPFILLVLAIRREDACDGLDLGTAKKLGFSCAAFVSKARLNNG